MAKYVSMTPAENESLDAFADRMAKKVAEHFGTSPTAPVPQDAPDAVSAEGPAAEDEQSAD